MHTEVTEEDNSSELFSDSHRYDVTCACIHVCAQASSCVFPYACARLHMHTHNDNQFLKRKKIQAIADFKVAINLPSCEVDISTECIPNKIYTVFLRYYFGYI